MPMNPEMKAQVYSLHVPNDDKCFQTKAFWSLFSLKELTNLKIFISNFLLLSRLTSMGKKSSEESTGTNILGDAIRFPQIINTPID
jgi:hypothetical protein